LPVIRVARHSRARVCSSLRPVVWTNEAVVRDVAWRAALPNACARVRVAGSRLHSRSVRLRFARAGGV